MPREKIVRFTKIKQWYIPADAESYRMLHRCRITAVRHHEDVLPTLRLLTRKRNLVCELVPFNELYSEFMDKVTYAWTKVPGRRVQASHGLLVFESKASPAQTLKVCPRLEACLRRFFRRWGFNADFEFSQTATRTKLVVTFAWDKDKLPVIEFIKGW